MKLFKLFYVIFLNLQFLIFTCLSPTTYDGTSNIVYKTSNTVFRGADTANGEVLFKGGITILGDASAKFNINTPIWGPIDLRSTGVLYLLNDLVLDSGVTFSSGGKIKGGGHTIFLTGDLSLPASSVFTFTGNTIIDGKGHDLKLGKYSQLFVDGGITVTFKNMTIKNTLNTISCPPIRCSDWYSQACFENVILSFNDDFAFRNGQFFIHDDVEFTGTSKFSYRSVRPSYIEQHSNMIFSPNTTFEYDPSTTDNALIKMADKTSSIIFDSSTLQATSTGIRLTKGSLYFDNKVTLSTGDILLRSVESPIRRYYGYGIGYSIKGVAWTPDGRFLIIGGTRNSTGNELQVYSFNNGTLSTNSIDSRSSPSDTLDLSPDGNYIVLGISSNISTYFFNNGTFSASTIDSRSAGGTVYDVEWHPSGKFLALACYTGGGNELKIYSFNNGNLSASAVLQRNYGTNKFLTSIAWSPDGKYVALGGNDTGSELKIYSFINETLSASPIFTRSHATEIESLAWSPDGKYLAVGVFYNGSAYKLNIYSFYNGLLSTNPTAQKFYDTTDYTTVKALAWSPDGCYFAVGGTKNSGNYRANTVIYTFDSRYGTLSTSPVFQQAFGDDGAAVNGLDWHPNQKYLAVGGYLFAAFGGGTDQDLLKTYPINYSFASSSQGFVNGISFGNSTIGSSQDLDVYILAAARVGIYGKVLQDSVNSSWNFQSRDSYVSLDRYNSQLKITNASTVQNWKKNQIIKSSEPNTMFLQDNQVWATNMDQLAPEETFEFMDNLIIPDGQLTQFSANTVIDGQGHDLILGKYAQLLVDGGVTVTFKNMTIKNTLNTISCPPIRCMDWYSKACFDNVTFAFNDDWAFRNGQFFVHNDVNFTGTSKFSYRSVLPSYIAQHSNLIFDPQTTFEFYPSTTDNALIKMTDKTSSIIFDGSTLQTTHTGIRLTKGSLYFDNKVTLSSADKTQLSTIISTTNRYYSQYAYCTDWNPNGKQLAVSGYNLRSGIGLLIYGWDGQYLTEITSLISSWIYSASWSPDGKYLAVSGYQFYTVYSWDGSSLVQLDTKGAGLEVYSVAWSPDGKYLAVGGNGLLIVYSWDGSTLSQLDAKSVSGVNSVAWSPEGKFLAAGGWEVDATDALIIYSWNQVSLTKKASAAFGDYMGSFATDKIYSVDWNSDGKFLAVGGQDTTTNLDLRVYGWNGSSLFATVLQDFGNLAEKVKWSPCGKYLAVGGVNGSNDLIIYDWNGSSLFQLLTQDFVPQIYGISWNYDGKSIAVGGSNDPTDLIVYGVNYTFDTSPQGFSSSIVFGNSVVGTTQDLDVNLMSGANIQIYGQVWYDNAN